MTPPRLIRGFLTVGFWTLLSRILGFARDIMIASALGVGPIADAFMAAFALPNLFRRFFAEGAFNTAFVPLFSKRVETNEGAHDFARDAMSGLSAILIVFSVVCIAAMPALIWVMYHGFVGDTRFDLAVVYGRIAFPYILFISIAALLSGVLNTLGKFVAAAAAPVLLNICFIAAMIIANLIGADMGMALAWSVPVAGIAQLTLLWVASARAGYRLVPRRPRMTPELKRLAIIAAPAALAGGVLQINLLVGRLVASQTEGAIAMLGFADRLYQLPLGVVAIAIGVVLLPELSRRLAADDMDGSQAAFSRAGEISLALTIPAAVALIVIPVPLVSALFERGAFDADASAGTAVAVAIYGLGLPAFVLQKVLQPLFYAREDTRSPFKYAVISMVVNAGLALGLAPVIGFYAAAIATTLSSWAMVVALWRGSRPMGQAARFDAQFKRRIWRICMASVAMGAVLWALMLIIGPMLGMGAWRYLGVTILVIGGMAAYFAIGAMIGAFRISDFKGAMRR